MVRASDFGPRGPWFESRPVCLSLWPSASHIYPLLNTGLTQVEVDRRPIWTDCDKAGDYVVPNLLSPRDLVSRPDHMDETVPHMKNIICFTSEKIIFFYSSLYANIMSI